MAEKPIEGFGRGGRGAALLAALKNQPRRPGQSSESPSPPLEETKPLGRGTFLSSFFSQGRGRAAASLAPTEETVTESPIVGGRGRGLALTGILGVGRGITKTESSVETAVATEIREKTPPSPPTAELEELTIKKYRGTSGTKLDLEVNYVRLNVSPENGIYEYHVSFSPSVDSKNMKFRLINQETVKAVIGNVKTFDGSKLYLPLKLSASPVDIVARLPTDGTSITVSIKFVKMCRPSDCIHLYNVLFRKVMNILKMTQVGRNYFDPAGGKQVPQHKLEIWPGYVTSVQDFEDGVMLNCDVSFRVLRTVTAYEVMQDMPKQGDFKEAITKALVGAVVLTRYNNKTYRVDDIAWQKNPRTTFSTRDGSEISFVSYYKKSYDIDIKDIYQPLIINKPREKADSQHEKIICLIPELCFMTGLTDAMRNDYKVMKDVAAFTRVTPEQRILALQEFLDRINNTPEAKNCFKNWNLQLDSGPVALDGRLLKCETLLFGNDSKVQVSPEADWGRQATSNKVLVAVHLEKWVIIHTKRDSSRAVEFIKMLRNVCPAMGIRVNDPIKYELNNDRIDAYCETIRRAVDPTVQVVVLIFPTPREDRYSAVKKLCCIEMPVPSQVINTKTISDPRKLRSVVQKIALQINCKLGGELWSVNIPLSKLMICGLDTYHDVSRGHRSVLGFVASINQSHTRWFSMTVLQKVGQEMGDSLKMLFTSALRKYFEVNHCLPDKIVLFRDGVSDGQLEYVATHEVEQLVSCFKHFETDYSPALSVVIVQKRINTRMFAVTHERNRKALINPQPGSILDHSVTRKKWYDFFLVSQHVRQGTVSPTHYVVLYDSSALKPEHMQRLAYKMTHLYYNWPGTVRVPAPCQYAHKLAYLVGQSLHKETHVDLSDKLFYL